jgi:hypothetical protein
MKHLLLLAAVAASVALGAADASAAWNANPYNGANHGTGGGFFKRQPLPAFQAAPWYLYFPYNAHFQTPSPMYNAPWYGPPASSGYGGGLTNPYFPTPNPGYAPAPVAPVK